MRSLLAPRFLPFVMVAVLASCSEQDVQRWEQFWAATQPASQPATQPTTAPDEATAGLAEPMDELSRLRLQRDRLLAANRMLQKDLDELREHARALLRRAEDLERQLQQQSSDLESRRQQLRQAMETLQKSRDEWEMTLADRQRQIEILRNKAERLERELAKVEQQTAPASTD